MTSGETRARWEARAVEKGDRLDGVLYRGFPPALNEAMHDCHVRPLLEALASRLPRGARVLDLGCGYGRLAEPLLARRPDLTLVGLDLAETYCGLFRQRLGVPAVCGRFDAAPFAAGSFDGVVACTVLMYAEPARRSDAVRGIMALLRPGGFALFIDPATEFMRLAALASPSSRDTPTGGHWFTAAEYLDVGRGAGAIAARGGYPVFSLLLPFLLPLARRFPDAARAVLRWAHAADRVVGMAWRFSIQRWLLVRRT